MTDYTPPPPTQDPGSSGPADSEQTSRYQPYPGQGPAPTYSAPLPPGYGGGRPPGGTPPAPPFGGDGGAFEDRLRRRPEPRFTVALAGVGAALALFGVAIWGGTYFGEGLAGSFGGSSDRNLLGAGLGALLVAIGYAVAITQRRGSLVTAAVVLIGAGVPLTMAFLTLDVTNTDVLNWDAVFWVSLVIWAATYVWVPGAKGHTFFVFLAANGLFTYVLVKNTDTLNFELLAGSGPRFTGLGTIAGIGLTFGLTYYVVAFLLDRSGRHGPATGLVYTAFNATSTGIIAWSPDIHLAGAGTLTILIGLAVCWYGGRFGRRLTCFAAGGAVALGIGLLVFDAVDDDAINAGVAFLLIGVVIVAVAALLAQALDERHDLDPEVVVGSR